jgi:hypothetical protein
VLTVLPPIMAVSLPIMVLPPITDLLRTMEYPSQGSRELIPAELIIHHLLRRLNSRGQDIKLTLQFSDTLWNSANTGTAMSK